MTDEACRTGRWRKLVFGGNHLAFYRSPNPRAIGPSFSPSWELVRLCKMSSLTKIAYRRLDR